MVQLLFDACGIQENDYQVAVLALDSGPKTVILVLRLCQPCPCMGRTTIFRINGWMLRDVTSFFRILQSVSVDQSGGLSAEIGVLYLSHAMLVLAELIVLNGCGTWTPLFLDQYS